MNTKDNTPAIIHYEIVDGDQVDITVAPKGFGSGTNELTCPRCQAVMTLADFEGCEKRRY